MINSNRALYAHLAAEFDEKRSPTPRTMSKKKPITVTVKEGKHATQPWTFSIDDPGPGPQVTVRERYTAKRSAQKGALRKLKATEQAYFQGIGYRWLTPDGRIIEFVTARK